MIGPRGILIVASLVLAFLLVWIGRAHSHDIYSEWKIPGTDRSCCDDRDCYPTPARFEQGQWFALRREDKKWLAIPDRAILKDGATPDGEAHLCAPAPYHDEDVRVYCFRPGYTGG